MVTIPSKSKGALNASSLLTINVSNPKGILRADTIQNLNKGIPGNSAPSPAMPQNPAVSDSHPAAQNVISHKPLPAFTNPIQKGQKAQLSQQPIAAIKACLGWNVTNSLCDIDVSAFLLSDNGKVIGDDWFVFYGQPDSPDRHVRFSQINDRSYREMIQVNFNGLNPSVDKIVFVLTINEAFERSLNFSMAKDAYIRILDASNDRELVSYQMTDYYSNVISMMIGELYRYKGAWKFNAIGNGVAKDLAGLCELYGVQVV